jgi:cytochrome oxidase Cu insertion factor (SCO1/SenC/PrrC family)
MMAMRAILLALAVLMAGLSSSAAAGQAPAPAARVDVSAVGPQPGTRVPDFTLPDQDGRSRTLASLAGPRGTMLVFSRSADW